MRAFFTALIVVTLSASAHAQSTEPPTFSVGDTWKRSHGQEVTVVSIDDKGAIFSGGVNDCPTCLARLDKNLNLQEITDANGKPVDVTRLRVALVGNWKFYEWPLEVKRSWSTSGQGFFQGQPQRYNIDFVVRTYDDVKTKAGTFKAYKIEQSWNNAYGNRSWINTVWYAPEVRSVVKYTSNNSNNTDWELISYSLK